MKAIHRLSAVALAVVLAGGLALLPRPAQASEEGRRNTAIGLGAAAALLLATQHNKTAGIVAAAGAVYAATRIGDSRRHRRDRYGYDDNRYDRDNWNRDDRWNRDNWNRDDRWNRDNWNNDDRWNRDNRYDRDNWNRDDRHDRDRYGRDNHDADRYYARRNHRDDDDWRRDRDSHRR